MCYVNLDKNVIILISNFGDSAQVVEHRSLYFIRLPGKGYKEF